LRKKPELSISEVAYESGFKDVSCFSHVFKKADGTCYELSEIEDMIVYIDKKKRSKR